MLDTPRSLITISGILAIILVGLSSASPLLRPVSDPLYGSETFYGLIHSENTNTTYVVTDSSIVLVPATTSGTWESFSIGDGVKILPHSSPVAWDRFIAVLCEVSTGSSNANLSICIYGTDKVMGGPSIISPIVAHVDPYSGRYQVPFMYVSQKSTIIYAVPSGQNCNLMYATEEAPAAVVSVCRSVAWFTAVNASHIAAVKKYDAPPQEFVIAFNLDQSSVSVISAGFDLITTVAATANKIAFSYRTNGDTYSFLRPDASISMDTDIRSPSLSLNVPWSRQFFTLNSTYAIFYTKNTFANDSATLYNGAASVSLPNSAGVPVAVYEGATVFALVTCKSDHFCIISTGSISTMTVDYAAQIHQFFGGGFLGDTFIYLSRVNSDLQVSSFSGANIQVLSSAVPECYRDQVDHAHIRSIASSRRKVDGKLFFVFPTLDLTIQTRVTAGDLPEQYSYPQQRLRFAGTHIIGASSTHVALIGPVLGNATQIKVIDSSSSQLDIYPTPNNADQCRPLGVGYGGHTFVSTSGGDIILASVMSSLSDARTVVLTPFESVQMAPFLRDDNAGAEVLGAFLKFATRPGGLTYFQNNESIFFQSVTDSKLRRIQRFDPSTLLVNASFVFVLEDTGATVCPAVETTTHLFMPSADEAFYGSCSGKFAFSKPGQLPSQVMTSFSNYTYGAYANATHYEVFYKDGVSLNTFLPAPSTKLNPIELDSIFSVNPTEGLVALIGTDPLGPTNVAVPQILDINNSSRQAQTLEVSPVLVGSTFRPLGWLGNRAVFDEVLLAVNADIIYYSLFCFDFGVQDVAFIQLDSRIVPNMVTLHGPEVQPRLEPHSCQIGRNMIVWYPTGILLLTDGTQSGTLLLADEKYPPARWNYQAKLVCTQGRFGRVYVEILDTNGIATVVETPAAPCVTHQDCIDVGLDSCNITSHFCSQPSSPITVVPAPPLAPTTPAPPQPPSTPSCVGPAPSPQFICNITTGQYVLNTTGSIGGVVVVNGSLNITTQVTIPPGATLVITSNLTISCNSSLAVGGFINVGGSASFCGTIGITSVTGGVAAINISSCVAFDAGTSIVIPAASVDTLLTGSQNQSAESTLAQFSCRLSTVAPVVSVAGGSANCQSVASTVSYSDRSLAVLFTGTQCGSAPEDAAASFPVVAVAVSVSIIGGVALLVVILLVIPKTRHAIFPFLKRRETNVTTDDDL